MIIGTDTGFLLRYAQGHTRATQIWDEMRRGEHRLIVPVLIITEYLAYHIPRGTLAQAEQAVEELKAMPNVDLVPISVEPAARSARYRVRM